MAHFKIDPSIDKMKSISLKRIQSTAVNLPTCPCRRSPHELEVLDKPAFPNTRIVCYKTGARRFRHSSNLAPPTRNSNTSILKHSISKCNQGRTNQTGSTNLFCIKKDDSIRFCVDTRKPNNVIQP